MTGHNTLELQVAKEGVGVYIDGVSLIDLLESFEAPYAAAEGSPGIAGGYAPVLPNVFLESAYVTESDEDLLLLGCRCCDVEGCWPMVARIRREGSAVIWEHFQQPHREEWSYSDFGPFVFDAKQYDNQIANVRIIYSEIDT